MRSEKPSEKTFKSRFSPSKKLQQKQQQQQQQQQHFDFSFFTIFEVANLRSDYRAGQEGNYLKF